MQRILSSLRILRLSCVLLILWFLPVPHCTVLYGNEIDRLIAAVNGRVLTEGDLELARNLNAVVFYEQGPGALSREDEIQRLVDRELMRQELQSFSITQEDETRIEARLQSIRDAYASKGGLLPLLRKLGLQESELMSYLRFESSMLRFVDFRFRPFVKVSEEEIRDYYETRLIPQLRKAGLDQPAMAQVSAKIEEILREGKINAVLEQWIKEIKRNSQIEYFDAVYEAVNSGPESNRR